MIRTSKYENKQFESKDDFKESFLDIMQPLIVLMRNGRKGRIDLGESGTVYSEDIRHIESFLRPLWAFGPFLVSYHNKELETIYLEGIRAGVNPEHPDYWGLVNDYDQRLVEMASLATTLLLAKDKTWDLLNEKEQNQLHAWLMQINMHEIPKSNWLFFRILVNISMMHCNKDYDLQQVSDDLDIIENSYIGNGWYFDENPTQIDYYISFAIHFYSLIYYKFMQNHDSERALRLKNRSVEFAQSFKHWFDEKGEALPFGRSLSYRFAQVGFWSALVFADVEAIPWGEMKGIISRNMQQWMAKEIFSRDGVLTIGYHYPNLVMAEGYNSLGSPYWSLKTYLLMAVPDEHPFWKADPKPLTLPTNQLAIPAARMLISHSKNQLQAYVAGQLEQKQAHVDAKYSKLVYSTTFGFSVSKGSIYYKQGGFDSALALSEENTYFRSKLVTDEYIIHDDYVISYWRPWPNVQIKTTVIPIDDWHLRIHDITNERALTAIEGGFSSPVHSTDTIRKMENGICYQSRIGQSTLINISGYQDAQIHYPEPNTNIYFSRSAYPMMEVRLEEGRHQLVSLVGGSVHCENAELPRVAIKNNIFTIEYNGKIKIVDVGENS